MSKDISESTPFGTGHAAAMARLGLSELRAAFYPESNVAQPGDLGLYGNATPVEVTEARRGEAKDPEPQPTPEAEPGQGSILADKIKQAETREPPERDDRDLDRG